MTQQKSQADAPRLPEGTIVHRDIPYVTNGHERQKLDLYLPKSEKKLPVIIWIHGGAFNSGSKSEPFPLKYLVEGYAMASIDYRLSQHAIFPAQIQDCKAATRWLRVNAEKYNLDPNRFGAWGTSAGGHLAAMLGMAAEVNNFDVGENLSVSSRVQAVVDYCGPTNFLLLDKHALAKGIVHNGPNTPASQLIGGNTQDNPEKVARANPVTYVTGDEPPFLIIHGDSDLCVPYHQSVLLEAALKKARVELTFYTVKGGGHEEFKDPNVPKITKEFFEKHLKTKQ